MIDTERTSWTAVDPARSPGPTAPLWIVVPARNEQGRLGESLSGFLSGMGADDRLVVVVNGSSDGTADVARAAEAQDPRITVLEITEAVGKGGAVLSGLETVERAARPGDLVTYADADLAVDATELRRLGAEVTDGDVVVGSRWIDPRSQLRPQRPLRRVASRTFNRVVRARVGLDLRDTQCAPR